MTVRLWTLVACFGGFATIWGCGSGGASPQQGGAGSSATNGGSMSATGGTATGGTNTTSGGAAGGDGGVTMTGPELRLPIEVLGSGAPDEAVVASTELELHDAEAADVKQLYVRCHRCGFYDPPEFEKLGKPMTKVKASVRVLGNATLPDENAPWVDVTDQTVRVEPTALAHGGINGGLVTLGFSVALDDATRARLAGAGGKNRIEFRFNGTEGNSNGYRVLDVQLQDESGRNLTPTTHVWQDVSLEKAAGQDRTELAAEGAKLWSGRGLLVKSPIVPRKLRAACNDCHAADGRDLQYFNYSDNSIVQRSRFHGLSTEQGQQIAAYLRSANYAAVPHVAAATPWNPPYQPGPGLDARPSVEWAAGAGIDAVLPDGVAFLKEMAGKPQDGGELNVTQAELDQTFDATKLLNTREMRVPLQFPDWNSWLPITHPLDIWTPDAGQTQGLFETGNGSANPVKVLSDLSTWLTAHKNPNGVYGDWSHLTADQRIELNGMLGSIGSKTVDFGGGSRGTRQNSDTSKPFGVELAAPKLMALLDPETQKLAPTDACGPVGGCSSFTLQGFIERADYGLYHWMAVKQWEVVHTWGLEEHRTVHGTKAADGAWQAEGEKRGWPYSWPSVFYVAPHMIYAPEKTDKGLREFYLSWENRLISYYRTNQWYQLQMTVNPGWAGASNGPMDWPYHQGFTNGVVDELNNAKQPSWIAGAHEARYFQILIKLAQLANTNLPFDAPDPQEPQNLFKNKGMQSKADLINKLSPTAMVDTAPTDHNRFHQLDDIAPGVYMLLFNAHIQLYNSLYSDTDPAKYRRCDPSNMSLGVPEQKSGQRFCADQTRTPFPLNDKGQEYLPFSFDGWTTQQYSFWGVKMATLLQADAARVKVWSDWNERMWPQ